MGLGADILILMSLLILSGFFSGAEVALISLPKARVKYMVSKKKLGYKFVERLKQDPQRMLATILIGNNLVNVAAAAFLTSIVINLAGDYAIAIATGIMTLLILVFGEITPKSIAAENNEFVSQIVAFPVWQLSIVLAPILNLLDKFLNKFMNMLGIKAKKSAVTEEEIRSMIAVAVEEGAINPTEKNLLHNVFEFNDINVEKIATPRADMLVISSKATVSDAIKLTLKRKFSRIPVYEKYSYRIVGIIYVKDLLKYIGQKIIISKIMKKPYFVPESMKISNLLHQFKKRKEHMAIVVDEHGAVDGLVTLEDVLEEIVGEIADETDEAKLNIVAISADTWLVDGKTEIDEVNKTLKMRLKGDDYDTFGGFVLKLSGKIPKVGEELTYKNFKLRVEETDKHRISTVRVQRA